MLLALRLRGRSPQCCHCRIHMAQLACCMVWYLTLDPALHRPGAPGSKGDALVLPRRVKELQQQGWYGQGRHKGSKARAHLHLQQALHMQKLCQIIALDLVASMPGCALLEKAQPWQCVQ